MSQMTLRDIPNELDQRLREMARERNTSLNKTIIKVLMDSLHLRVGETRKRDLSDLAGTWTAEEAKEFEENTRQFEHVDEEVWRT